jgi:hypothetical protein
VKEGILVVVVAGGALEDGGGALEDGGGSGEDVANTAAGGTIGVASTCCDVDVDVISLVVDVVDEVRLRLREVLDDAVLVELPSSATAVLVSAVVVN